MEVSGQMGAGVRMGQGVGQMGVGARYGRSGARWEFDQMGRGVGVGARQR